VFVTSKHEYKNRITIFPVVYLVFEAQSITAREKVGCGVSTRGADKDYGAGVGGTESKLGTLCDEQLYSL
jgi:Na+/H+-translocating membrane pyrophosphatase